MARLTILADENIPFAAEAFGTIGDVRLKHGRQIAAPDLADVDVLVVRSITKVDRALLAGSRVRFVGTATSGSDHVAKDELADAGVMFYAALGCNANAVAEYMATAWLVLGQRTGRALHGLRVGVVGVGHVGSLVAEKARALGMVPVLNDPPKARETGLDVYRPLDELLDCDIVTCHTPLTRDGDNPTFRLIGDGFLSQLKRGAWFCSAGRGEVVDEAALNRALDDERLGACILDVWDHEPSVDDTLVSRVDLATPHIAGYSLEGKMNGTSMVYRAVCAFYGITPAWRLEDAAPPPTVPHLALNATGRDGEAVVAEATTAVYPIVRDDDRMRRIVGLGPAERGRDFDDQRKAYPTRREFTQTSVDVVGGAPSALASLRALGFRVDAAR